MGHGRSQELFGGGGRNTFRKFSNNVLTKLRKMHYFSIFSEDLTSGALIFSAFGRKTQVIGSVEKISKGFLRKLR